MNNAESTARYMNENSGPFGSTSPVVRYPISSPSSPFTDVRLEENTDEASERFAGGRTLDRFFTRYEGMNCRIMFPSGLITNTNPIEMVIAGAALRNSVESMNAKHPWKKIGTNDARTCRK